MGKGEVHLIWIRGYEDVWGCVEGGLKILDVWVLRALKIGGVKGERRKIWQ